VTFGAVIRRQWSDGVTTNEPATGSQVLQRAITGSSSFATFSSTSCNYTTDISFTYQYRCVNDGTNFTPVTVTALTRSCEYVLSAPVLSPAFAVQGATVTVSGTIQERYSDGSLWPALPSTTYSVEFRSEGSTSWRTVVTSRALNSPGAYSATFSMTGSGSVRVVRGFSDQSPTVELKELIPSTTYQLGALTLPSETAPRVTVPMSTTVKALWSDGSYKDAPDGTVTNLEFAASFDPSSSANLTWTRVEQGTTRAGVASFSTIPQASGFWRINVGTTSTNPTYMTVTGSAPLQVASSMTPVAGERPFVGTSSRYTINSSLTGYVGSETVTLFVDLGAGFERVAPFSASGAISGVFAVRAGSRSGAVTPLFEVRDSAGAMIASALGAPIVIDGIKSYTITAVPPTQVVREGTSTKVTATLSGVSEQGVRVALNWSGEVQVQRKSGRGWVTVARQPRSSGGRVSLSFPVADKSKYRVYWPSQKVASSPFNLKVITATNVFQFSGTKASRTRIELGQNSEISVRVRQQFSDKKFYPVADGTRLTLQTFVGNSWTKQTDVSVSRGVAKTKVKPGGTRSYRFVTSSGLTSPSVTVTVIVPRPTRLAASWPSTYTISVGSSVGVTVRTSSGAAWPGTTTLQLQYRLNPYASWTNISSATYRGETVRLRWGGGRYYQIYFRVIAPSLGLSSSQVYTAR
jgi:hypothetical protein